MPIHPDHPARRRPIAYELTSINGRTEDLETSLGLLKQRLLDLRHLPGGFAKHLASPSARSDGSWLPTWSSFRCYGRARFGRSGSRPRPAAWRLQRAFAAATSPSVDGRAAWCLRLHPRWCRHSWLWDALDPALHLSADDVLVSLKAMLWRAARRASHWRKLDLHRLGGVLKARRPLTVSPIRA